MLHCFYVNINHQVSASEYDMSPQNTDNLAYYTLTLYPTASCTSCNVVMNRSKALPHTHGGMLSERYLDDKQLFYRTNKSNILMNQASHVLYRTHYRFIGNVQLLYLYCQPVLLVSFKNAQLF